MNMNKGEKIKLPHLVAEILENKLIENYRPLSKQLSQLGIKAWKNARDATDFTPEDYARKRDHISYIQMVQSKIDSRLPNADVSVAMISTDITSPFKQVFVEQACGALLANHCR